MFLKCSTRRKDGREHRSCSIVESRRLGRSVVQRNVLYLGEINDSQCAAWQKAIDIFDERDGQPRQCALFPHDRTPPASAAPAVQGQLPQLHLCRLHEIQAQELTRDQWIEKLGGARDRAGRAVAGLVKTAVDAEGKLTIHLDRAQLRSVRQREGRYLLRTNLGADNPELVWRCHLQLVFVEEAFRTLKSDLGLRRTEPDKDVALLLARLKLELPQQPPPHGSWTQSPKRTGDVVATLGGARIKPPTKRPHPRHAMPQQRKSGWQNTTTSRYWRTCPLRPSLSHHR